MIGVDPRKTRAALEKKISRQEAKGPDKEKQERLKEVEDVRDAINIMNRKVERFLTKTNNSNLHNYLTRLQMELAEGIKIVDFVYKSIKKC